MKYINIYRKGSYLKCLVDDNDFEFMNQWVWSYRCGYASRFRKPIDGPGTHWIHFHRIIIERKGLIIPKGHCVDHINRNKLDNTADNLRVVTRSDNGKNVSIEVSIKRIGLAAKATHAAALLPRTEKQINCAKFQAKMMNTAGYNRHIGKDNYNSKAVLDTSTQLAYVSIREAAKCLGYNYSTLKSKLNGNNPNNTSLVIL